MASMSLPPGFRFHPTDVELVMYYLKRKVLGKKFQFEAISELNIYKFSPWDLPDKSCLKSKDLEWYFFCPRERKYASGARMNRATETGYWKTTGKDRAVLYNDNTVGMVKTLVFHQGHAPHGERTDWVIHEYRLQDKQLADVGIAQDAYVLCKVFQKNGPGPKNGAQYGAPFKEEEWDDDAEDCYGTLPSGAATHALALPVNPSCSVITSKGCPDITSAQTLPETGPYFSGAPKNSDVPDDDIICLLASFTEDNIPPPHHNDNNEMLDNNNHERNISNVPCSDRNDFYHDLGDLGNWPELGDSGISFTAIQEAGYVPNATLYPDAYMELNDLEIPLNSSAVVNGSEHMQTSTNLNATYNLSNVEGLYHGVNPFGMNEYYSGSNDLPSLPGRSSGVGLPSEMHQTNTNQLYNASYRSASTEPDESRGINHGCDGTNTNQVYNDAFSFASTQLDASRGIDQNHGGGRFVICDVNSGHGNKI